MVELDALFGKESKLELIGNDAVVVTGVRSFVDVDDESVVEGCFNDECCLRLFENIVDEDN